MAQSDYSKPLTEVTFRCACKRTFSAVPASVEPFPERDWHPWRYLAPCPECGADAAAAHWWLALLKGWQNATGPKTPEGIAATAANLEGHPTPDEAMRTRFNAMKHGLNSRTATYFPAKPGKYAQCATCDVDFDYCATQPCCTRQTGLFMKFAAAFERRDPNLLMDLYADQQAGVFAIVQQLMQSIIADGVALKTPRVHVNKDGEVTVIDYIDEKGERRVIHDLEAQVLFVSVRNRTVPEHEYRGENRRLRRKAVLDMIKKHGKQQGINLEQLHPHALRHLYGTELREEEIDLITRQRLMGHADPKTTEIYDHLAMRKVTRDVDRGNPLAKIRTPATDLLRQLRAKP